MIEIHLLEQLLTFERCGTLSEAAKELHISQPALSRSMQKLEEEMGVLIFERQKNKLTLNENGKILVRYAHKILDMEEEMVRHVRAFDVNNHRIVWGSCALSPKKILSGLLEEVYPEKKIVSEIEEEQQLLQKLEKGIYSFVVLTHPLKSPEYISEKWEEEYLYLTIPKNHPLAERDSIILEEIGKSNILMYAQTGFWLDILKKKIPEGHFVIHDEYEVMSQLMKSADWPIFQTNYSILTMPEMTGRVCIPVLDEEVNVTYYCVCKKQNYSKMEAFFRRIKKQ